MNVSARAVGWKSAANIAFCPAPAPSIFALACVACVVFLFCETRGLAFEAWLKWRMGNVEITDQEDCVRWAVEQVCL